MLLTVAMTPVTAFTDEYYSDHGFSIDLPEGFEVVSGDGTSRYTFGSADGAVVIDIGVYPSSRFMSAKAGAEDTAKKLSGKGTFSTFMFGNYDAALGELNLGTGATALRGYGFFVNNAETPASESSPASAYDLIVLSYAPASSFETYRDIVASALDGFSMTYSNRALPGPLGTHSRATLGKKAVVAFKDITFGSAKIRAEWIPAEAAIAQDLVEREYRVLSATVAESADLMEAAMARFYRMVFRDSAQTLDKLALQMSAAWETGAWSGKKPAALLSGTGTTSATLTTPPSQATQAPQVDSPRFGTSADPRGYAQALLAWVQGFVYERDSKGSDVVNPVSAAFQGRGDCDSRALVMSILLRRENIDSILMISLVHEHALAAVDAPGAGARYPFGGKQWLVAETTARVDIGRIDAAQADPATWTGIDFPE